MIKAKKGYILRRLGKEYMVVPVGEASREFNGMIRMNETGAFYWKELEQGISRDSLVAKMLERFEDLDEDRARRDLEEFLETVKMALEYTDGEEDH